MVRRMSDLTATRPASRAMDGQDWGMLGILSVVWGASFLFYKVLAGQMPPMATVAGRLLIGGGLLVGGFSAAGVRVWAPRRTWPALVLLGTFSNALPFMLFAWSESRIASGTAAILNAMTPIATLLVSGLVLRSERITRPKVLGIGCGVAGVAMLVGPEALLGQDVLGQFACLAATVCYGFGLPLSRRLTGVSPAQMAVGQMVGAALVAVPVAALTLFPWTGPAPGPAGWEALAGISVFSTAAAYVLFFRILERAGPTNLSLVTFLVPVSALLFGAVLLHEPVTLRALAGMGLIAMGLAAIDGRLFRAFPTATLRPRRR